ncbi:E3 ubiquitin-protein ligase SIAH1-like [Aricia agestis]|uniref:E3 ubiquitin-protein ligase SIAH1-like n=1 Tax=Aricia agestis TaxID=91739 RepID=UPI001C2063B3|nr:E3 ubiquitin-protein ligase SIAH1-like [Aricia agestis]XP_041978518.1 E3 ubiquitin-protein ligase SIAH1-like [Aricia agestis]XP_041978519.1 E3 ubiquitin-protein ligase SIAH1-like [Aricia agestis]
MAKPKAGRMPMTGLEVPKCPVCMDDMTSPIFQCQTGHSVCHACTKELVPSKCPLCSQVMTQMRNWQLEELVDKAKKECPNKAVGCGYIMNASEIDNHLKECIFREMNCPHGEIFGACSWSGKIKDLFEHFKSNHAENCRIRLDQESELKVNSSTDNRLMFMLSQGKYLFLFTIKIDTYQKMIYYVVQHIGIKKFAQQFVYEINIVSKKDSRRKVIFIDHCYSDTSDIKEIFSNGTCGIMPLGMFAHFVENDRITLKISIKNEAFVKNTKDYAKRDKNEFIKKGPNKSEKPNFRSKSPGPHMEDCKTPHKGPRGPRKQESQK